MPDNTANDMPEGIEAPNRAPNNTWRAPEYTQSRQSDLDLEHLRRMRCIGFFSTSAATSAYKILRTQVLQRMNARGWNTCMITSARPGEGKTLTAINLAFVGAKEFAQTVLLVDCDLKQQMVHKYLGVESAHGIADYLLKGTEVKDLITWPSVDKLTFISGGEPVTDSTELLNSPRMQTLIPEMKSRYADRIIIFDTPSLLEDADALAFLPQVEGVLVVADAGRTTKEDLRRTLTFIPQEKLLGFALNRHANSPVETMRKRPPIQKLPSFLKKQ